VYELLKEHGDALVASRDVTHWLYFKAAADRAQFIALIKKAGFDKYHLTKPNTHTEKHGVVVHAVAVPDTHDFEEQTALFARMAEKCGGEYDGWETEVISPKPH
jgi:hypothetical protein